MGVNGGTGNAISLSEIQSFYGGSNPISMSEYYRGGPEVPSTRTDTTTNTGITALVNQGASGTSGSALTGNQSSLTIDGPNNGQAAPGPGTGTITFSASTTVSATKDAGNTVLVVGDNDNPTTSCSLFQLGGYDFFDGSNRIRASVVAGSGTDEGQFVTMATLTTAQASGTVGLQVFFQKPSGEGSGVSPPVRIRRGGSVIHSLTASFDNGTGSAEKLNITDAQSGDIVEVQKTQSGTTTGIFLPRECIGGNANNTFAAGSYAVSFKSVGGNNNLSGFDATLSFSTSGTVQYTSFGGTFTSVSTTNSDVTVNTNTNVQASGAINMNIFNAPGTASP